MIQAVRRHEPDVIGLSGLLVKSAQQMVATAGDFAAAGIDTDLVVGGAALTRRFTHGRIAPEYGGVGTYASDAMSGLDLIERLREAGDPKRHKARSRGRGTQGLARGAMAVRGVWRFFPARSDGNRLTLVETGEVGAKSVAAEWRLPRQPREDGLRLADYVLPAGDHVALFVVTAGAGVREGAERFKNEGEYLKSHAYAALALETAEAAAELLHQRLRTDLGFPDPPGMTTRERLAAKYRGKRYSFGYPACPDLAGQRQLFAALQPADIGVELTEGDMMDPEATVSALVFHHPDARYFGV